LDFEAQLAEYEQAIGDAGRRAKPAETTHGERPWVVLSDPHIPQERKDLVAEVCARHKGDNCLVAGDLLDFGKFSRWLQTDCTEGSLEDLLGAKDAFLATLARHFGRVRVLEGNHDARLWRKAAQLGADYYWLTQEFFRQAYKVRHGVEVVARPFKRRNGRTTTLCFYDQIGDCVIGHVERSGATPVRGARLANEFFQQWRRELKLEPWPYRVLLQAHTHRQGYWFDPVTRVHCYEIGALCDEPDWAVLGHRSAPVQHGYYYLVQREGVTDLDRSRLYTLDD